MYVVTVEFMVEPQQAAAFLREVVANARVSRDTEPGCRQFDVCAMHDDPTTIFLYEVYTDRAAFDAHLATSHFRSFDAAVGSWVARRTVRIFERIES